MSDLKLPEPARIVDELTNFLRQTFSQIGKAKAVIAVSGGIDSALALTLLAQALGPGDVFPIFLPYHEQNMKDAKKIADWNEVPRENWREINIGPAVDKLAKTLLITAADRMRLGNVMARTRMIVVFDLAKKLDALVCGTENKSEHYLGYFTRFGDAASDVEPLSGLYKTQVRQLAKHLRLPAVFLKKAPSAGLWHKQTDENELGFTYDQADRVMNQLIDQGKKISEIKGVKPGIVEKIIKQIERMGFKNQVPYTLK